MSVGMKLHGHFKQACAPRALWYHTNGRLFSDSVLEASCAFSLAALAKTVQLVSLWPIPFECFSGLAVHTMGSFLLVSLNLSSGEV